MVLSVKGNAAAYEKGNASIYDVILGIVALKKGIVSVNVTPRQLPETCQQRQLPNR